MRLNLWAPQPPSGVSDYAAEQAEALAAHLSVARISETESASPPAADLDLYHVGNSPAHGFVHRAALARPGVVLFHDWSLQELVRSETLGQGDARAYEREMRRAHGEAGAFAARQTALGLGSASWAALFPLNDRVLEGSLGIVALNRGDATRASARLRDLPVLTLPRHLSPSGTPLLSRSEARKVCGLPEGAFVVTTAGREMTAGSLELAMRVIDELRVDLPELVLVVPESEDLTAHLIAADVVLALHGPTDGGSSDSVVRALGLGRVVLVTAGTAADHAFPEGVVVPIAPGTDGAAHLEAVLSRLITDEALRESVGRVARAHVLAHHDLTTTARVLADFLRKVEKDRARLERAVALRCPAKGSLDERLLDEARATALELGLDVLSLDIGSVLGSEAAESRERAETPYFDRAIRSS